MSVTFPSSGCPSFFRIFYEEGIVMKLTVYYDGQFWVGVIEAVNSGKLRAFRHVFGKEPKDPEVLDFVHHQLLHTISQTEQEGVSLKGQPQKKINPKRLQRQVSKEVKHAGVTSKAQEAIKLELEARKQKKKQCTKEMREHVKEQKYILRKQKAKKKHRGK
ncbi:YjdF family protein [Bacillus cabrialesii]|uniref:YjdF family protein n=1 Tax=Bacillus cabrialesii TaxID=2487276 RepID=UPI00101080FC|nr:YjdF family protein [Bacillus cabrialesii]UQE81005.1 YjdF family protein [Bacillus cabrialesii]